MLGIFVHSLFDRDWMATQLLVGLFDLGGQLFMNALKMLVVPVVFISLVCGTFSLKGDLKLSHILRSTFLLYVFTTAVAVSLALLIAHHIGVGGTSMLAFKQNFQPQQAATFQEALVSIVPTNPIAALSEGNMLQIILFALLFGTACNHVEDRAERVKKLFFSMQAVIMDLMTMVIKFTPAGVFCLVANLFSEAGLSLVKPLASYFFTVLGVLALQLVLTYGLMIRCYIGLKPYYFFRHMLPAMMFAFSTSSSGVSIPIVLRTVKERLGVHSSIASFVIPFGATVNMDGTAIMQGVATVFIANTYGIDLSLMMFLKVILTATLASIGTAAIPGIGLITLMMVLTQAGLPTEGIALIIGVDRLLDMSRTAVNVAGDAMVACAVARQEDRLDLEQYERFSPRE